MKDKFLAVALVAVSILLPASSDAQMTEKDIVDTAVEAGSFSTLAVALEAAGLVDVLKGKGPFTVFAPTDAAFDKLPDGILETLLADKQALTEVLTFHVVEGAVMSEVVMKMTEVGTVSGFKAEVKVESGQVYAAGAKVITADIVASNGVIHVIDNVMLPPALH
mgnify:CR=1 FL=1|jgi:uncharacterized surface protein with fasciclin (FAS1) repeats|tara:strand:+ start:1037 stop:1528 length:492 start_codon:yes stop_codon:yes gene_type:complete